MSTCQGSWIRLNLPCPSADPESTISLVASANLFNEYSEGRLSHTSVPGSYSSEYSEGAVDRSMASIIRACTPTRSRCSLPLAISSHRVCWILALCGHVGPSGQSGTRQAKEMREDQKRRNGRPDAF
ncbi:uncharacterized protein AB9W97_012498 isoform 2-T2 [Spinachia spinachia]